MPVTHLTFAVAVLAISGIWPFAGFFSKDEILTAALEGKHYLHFYGGLIVAGLTAFYMARIYFLAFWGQSRSDHSAHAHEASVVMLIPLTILAILSCVTGFIPFGHFVSVGQVAHEAEGLNMSVAIPGSTVALLGLFFSWFFYGQKSHGRINGIAQSMGGVYTTIKQKFYFDEIYQFVTHRIIFKYVAAPISWFDRNVVDGGVNLSGQATREAGAKLTLLQTGQLQTYGFWLVMGTLAAAFLFYLRTH